MYCASDIGSSTTSNILEEKVGCFYNVCGGPRHLVDR